MLRRKLDKLQNSYTDLKDQLIKTYSQNCTNKAPLDDVMYMNTSPSNTDTQKSIDLLLNQCITNSSQAPDPIQSKCHGQLGEYECTTLPGCTWNTGSNKCVTNASSKMFKHPDTYKNTHNPYPIQKNLSLFPQSFKPYFYWWESLDASVRASMKGDEDNWTLRLSTMTDPSFGIFPHTFIRIKRSLAGKIARTLLSCGNMECLARMAIYYSQTDSKRWLELVQIAHVNRKNLPGGRYQRFYYELIRFLKTNGDVPLAERVMVSLEATLEWIKQSVLFVHFVTDSPRQLSFYGVSSAVKKS